MNPAPAAEYSIFDKDINLDVRSAASTDSEERKPSATLAGLSQRISDIEDRLDRRPKDDDAVIRRLSKYIVEDMIGINPHLRTLTDRYDYDDRTEKYLKRLDVPYGYTVIRRREDNRWVWYRVNIQVLRILDVIYSDVRAGKKPADLLDVHKIRWRPYGKGEYEYLGDYIFAGNEISEEDDRSDMKQDDRTGFNTKRNYGETDRGRLPDSPGVKDIDKNGAVPNNECGKSGQADVRDRSSMKRSYDTDIESDALEEYDEESVGQSVESSDGPGSGMSADVRSTSVNASSVKISPDGYGDVRDVIVNRREYDFGLEDVPETGD